MGLYASHLMREPTARGVGEVKSIIIFCTKLERAGFEDAVA